MWSDPNDAAYVHELHERLNWICGLTERLDHDAFLNDRHAPDALAMNFLALGEAANQLSEGFRGRFPDVEWRRIINLRHLIAHHYRKIDHAELWRIASEEAPRLKASLPYPPPPNELF